MVQKMRSDVLKEMTPSEGYTYSHEDFLKQTISRYLSKISLDNIQIPMCIVVKKKKHAVTACTITL